MRIRLLRLVSAFFISVFAVACVAIDSEPIEFSEQTHEERRGWAYSLPKGVFYATLYDASSASGDRSTAPLQFQVFISGPHFIADSTHSYRLNFDEAPFNSETAAVYYYPRTPFLKEIRFRSSGELDEALVAATKAGAGIDRFIAAQAGEIADMQPVAGPFLVDMASAESRDRAAAMLVAGLDKYLALVGGASNCGAGVRDGDAPKCAIAELMREEILEAELYGESYIGFSLAALEAPETPLDVAHFDTEPLRSCSTGPCYRPLRPFRLMIRFGPSDGVVSGADPWRKEQIVMLPNASAPIALPLDRPVFAQRGARITFDYPGLPATLITYRESEGAEALILPFELVGAAIGATVSGVSGTGQGVVDGIGDDFKSDPNYTTNNAPIKFGPETVETVSIFYPPYGAALQSSGGGGLVTGSVDTDRGDAGGGGRRGGGNREATVP